MIRKARSKRPYKPLDLSKRLQIMLMAMEDYSISSISKELRVARNTVKKYIEPKEKDRTMTDIVEVVKVLTKNKKKTPLE
ncbi:MAG: hypothetical protein ACTSRA_00300 [Promethearchaeota archaeon]|nr:MAG: homeobox [Helarchaeota virus Nidhogg Meg22_1012]URC17395.1 MAG: homeobox [Helarchaeota virus Nidhogg Meg22_1214]